MRIQAENLINESDKSSAEVEKAIKNILPAFEKNMNNDLDVKSAFDEVYDIIHHFHRLKSENRLGKRELDTLVSYLERIDNVLQVLL